MGGYWIGLGLNIIIALRFLLELEAFDRHNFIRNAARIAIAKLALLFRIIIFLRNKSSNFLFCLIDKQDHLAFCTAIALDRSLLIRTTATGHIQHISSPALTIRGEIHLHA